jgi:hypothetical protein
MVAAAWSATAETIANPATAPVQEAWTLREAWRVGGDDESDVLLGQVGVVASGPDREVYALDSQLCQVLVFSADGEHLRTLGRQGDGPGEFRQPVNLFLPGDGTVGVQQPFPGMVTYLDTASGLTRHTWRLGQDDPEGGGFGFVETARRRGGSFAVAAAQAAFDLDEREIRNTNFLGLFDADGHEIARVAEINTVRSLVRFTVDELAQYFPGERGLWDLSCDGDLYVAARYDAYTIDVHDGEGTLLHEITREHDARPRTDQEKEDQRNSMQIDINGMRPEIDWKLADRARAIERLQILDDGSLWVQDSHGADAWADAGRMVYGVFDAAGKLQREVTVTVPEGGEGHRLVLLDDGRFLLIKGLDSISVSVSVGDDDEINATDDLSDTLLELVCFEEMH